MVALKHWEQKPQYKAMLSVDNAGTDVVLGEVSTPELFVCCAVWSAPSRKALF